MCLFANGIDAHPQSLMLLFELRQMAFDVGQRRTDASRIDFKRLSVQLRALGSPGGCAAGERTTRFDDFSPERFAVLAERSTTRLGRRTNQAANQPRIGRCTPGGNRLELFFVLCPA